MTGCPYRAGLPPPPPRVAALPLDERGYPVPWFVATVDGKPDHRVADGKKFGAAIAGELCWMCGGRLGAHAAFLIGPMCAVNRVSSEPPSHLDCADYAARACPWMTRPDAQRRESGLPDDKGSFGGVMLKRNPGVVLLWVTKKWNVFPDGRGGVMHDIGDNPTQVRWYREGRPATRAEVVASIESGCPALEAIAQTERGGMEELTRRRRQAERHYPAATL